MIFEDLLSTECKLLLIMTISRHKTQRSIIVFILQMGRLRQWQIKRLIHSYIIHWGQSSQWGTIIYFIAEGLCLTEKWFFFFCTLEKRTPCGQR